MADGIAALQKQIERKKADIETAEHYLAQERGVLQGMEAALKTILRASGLPAPDGMVEEKKPRAGTDIAKCQEHLQLNGKPMHIDELLKVLGKQPTKANRTSLAGSLASYVRDHKWFTRTAPNTFGLIGMTDVEEGESGKQKPSPVM